MSGDVPVPERRARRRWLLVAGAPALLLIAGALAVAVHGFHFHPIPASLEVAREQVASAEKAFEADPADPAAALELIYLLQETDKPEQASAVEARHEAAVAARRSASLPELEAAVARKPGDWSVVSSILQLLEARGQLAEAKKMFEGYVRAAPSADNHASFGLWLLEHEQPDAAAGELEQAIAGGSERADVRAYLCQAYLALGRQGEAARVLEEARRIDPDDDVVEDAAEALHAAATATNALRRPGAR